MDDQDQGSHRHLVTSLCRPTEQSQLIQAPDSFHWSASTSALQTKCLLHLWFPCFAAPIQRYALSTLMLEFSVNHVLDHSNVAGRHRIQRKTSRQFSSTGRKHRPELWIAEKAPNRSAKGPRIVDVDEQRTGLAIASENLTQYVDVICNNRNAGLRRL